MVVSHVLTCLSKDFDGVSHGYHLILSCWVAQGRNGGRLDLRNKPYRHSPALFDCLSCLIFSTSCLTALCFQPYNQKEPPAVRVVEGPLFSEVVAQYQHFQQTVRIHNVPGNKRRDRLNRYSSDYSIQFFLAHFTPSGAT